MASADDVHQHLRAVLVQPGDGDPVGGRVARVHLALALQRDDPVGKQPGPAAVHQHPRPPASQFFRQGVPLLAEDGGAACSSRSQRAYRAMPTRSNASTSCTICQPSSTSPSTSAAVTGTPSRKTSLR